MNDERDNPLDRLMTPAEKELLERNIQTGILLSISLIVWIPETPPLPQHE